MRKLTYHSGNRDHSKHPFRMIANANIDKLMITFYHCPYTRTNTCTGQNSNIRHQMLPDGHCFLLCSFPLNCQKLARYKVRCHVVLFATSAQERRFVSNRSLAMHRATKVLDRAMRRIEGKLLPNMVARGRQ